MNPARDLDAAAYSVALCRNALYGALSLGLHPPTREGLAQLAAPQTRKALLEAARCLERDAAASGEPNASRGVPAFVRLKAGARIWGRDLGRLGLEEWSREHSHLFGHTVRGSVCPYESEYGQNALFQQSHQLADLEGFYTAFGLALAEDEHERADHISCELEFMEFLSCKEAYALEAGDDLMLEGTRRGTRLFLQEHLGRFGRAFGLSLQEAAPHGFHAGLGRLLHDFLLLDSRRHGIETGPAGLQLRDPTEADVPMQCGSACDPTDCAPAAHVMKDL